MTTEHHAEKQRRIEQRMRARTAEYPALWQRMMDEWLCPEPTDRAWLLYSANYLFRTAGVRWALDPLTLSRRVPSAPPVDVSSLKALDYIVLSHRHHDHFDPPLLEKLASFPARWVVPPFMVETVLALGLSAEKVIPLPPGESLPLGGISLTAFDGLHWEASPEAPSGRRGVHAAGYLVEFNNRRWCFPGDVRTYDPNLLPIKDDIHGLVAHVWLGRGQAQAQPPPLLDAFCRFCLDLQPGQVVLTHLEEFGRQARSYWDGEHAELVRSALHAAAPALQVSTALMGESFPLQEPAPGP